jgi:hypothetical protein
VYILSIHERLGKLLACIALLFVVLVVTDTYSKYLTEASGTTDIAIARWRILVNGQDIRNNADLSQVISPTIYQNNHIASNVIAPRSTGYFDLVIDCRDADVSFEYEIDISPNEDSSVTDLVATGYSIDGGSTVSMDRGDTISNQVLLSSHTQTISIRVYIEWDDTSNDATMDNEDDTEATKSGDDALLDVNLSFIQLNENNNNNNNNEPSEP